VVGDPLCAVAGWLKLPFWPCVAYMLVGKFGRYLVFTAALIGVFPGQYSR
jgi:membrane protein YqaA with SNARE-associated domain